MRLRRTYLAHRRKRSAGCALFAAGILVVPAIAGPGRTLDRESSFGEFASVHASGELGYPKPFVFRITSDPPGQEVEGSVYMSCRDEAFDSDDRDRPLRGTTPMNVKIALTMRKPRKCFASASASFEFDFDNPASGRLTGALYGKKRR